MFTLEPLDEDDFDFRYGVYAATIKSYIDQFFDWDEEQHREMIRSHLVGSGMHLAIVVNGTRVGAAQIEETDDVISLHQIAILPDYQGAGTGTAVICSLMRRAEESNRPVRLSVFLLNRGARRLYEKLGFQVVSTSGHDAQMQYTPPAPGTTIPTDDSFTPTVE